MPFDLTSAIGVKDYLSGTPFASTLITLLSGGSDRANYIYRLHLEKKVDGRASLVLKHARPVVEDISFQIGVERQKFEAEALRVVRDHFGVDSLVTVPTLYYFDAETHAVIMSDCGEGALNLKEWLIRSALSPSLARSIGRHLGEFMARLHVWSSNQDSVLDFFAQNKEGIRVYTLVTYGQLESTVLGTVIDPPIHPSDRQLETIRRVATDMTKKIATSRNSLLMGDLWPGNFLVSIEQDPRSSEMRLSRIHIVDFELARPGPAGTDIGQLCAELALLPKFHPETSDLCVEIRHTLLEAYRATASVDASFRRETATHIGAHLVAWTPIIWSGRDKEKIREMVVEGMKYLEEGPEASETWLKASICSELV